MGNKKFATLKQQAGFTVVEVLLALIALTLISFSGWYVWNSNNKAEDSKQSTASVQKNTGEKDDQDPTDDWKQYTSTEGKFTLKYPPSWLTATNPSLCGDSVLLLGSTSEAVGKCGSDSGGQMNFQSFTVESGSLGLDENYYDGVETKSVKVDGVKGERQSGTYSYTGEGIGPTAGSKAVVYVFKTNGRIYKAYYTQESSYPDVLDTFDTIVIKTLRFN